MQYGDNDTVCMYDKIREIVDSGAFDLALRLGDVHSDPYAISGATLMGPPPQRDATAGEYVGEYNGHKSHPQRHNRTYYTKKPICRMTCTVSDASILQDVTSKMLGPMTDFDTVMVDITHASRPGGAITLLGNITNSVQTPQMHAQLGIVVVDVLDTRTGDSMNCDALCCHEICGHG